MPPKITKDGISYRRNFKTQMLQWDEIHEVQAVNADMITYAENYLVFFSKTQSQLNIGELAVGVESLDDALRYLGIERNWYEELERGGVGTTLILYKNTEAKT